ncbi:MAG: hypothetical protein RI601_12695 [Desulfurivibrionaceae bacterium]|nr:hypothetical protein [Desulfurivibrionaceae bacterium]
MKELAAQWSGESFVPFSPDDLDAAKNFKVNQIVKLKVVGCQKQRSASQLGLFMACCEEVAYNARDKGWDTKEKVKQQVKVALHYVVPDLVVVKPDGTVIFKYRSFAFSELKHFEACRIFDRGLDVLADYLKTDVDTLIAAAQEKMQKRGIRTD